jgi:hypothetical protein
LLATLATAVATPVLGQAVAPTLAPASSTTQGTASIPDLSGVWAHPYFPGFEPPASGPGPVLNKSRLHGGLRDGEGNPSQFVGDYANPILKPVAAEIVKKHGDISLTGGTYPTPSTHCWPSGVPYIFFQLGLQMLQQPDQITFLYLRDHEVRHVRLNQPHPAPVKPSWYGDSVGHYEGNTLVIDTVGVKVDRPLAMLDMFGTPYSPALHIVERYRLLDYAEAKPALERNNKENIRFLPGNGSLDFDPDYRGKHLQLEFTVEDDGVFTMPWSATITYARPMGPWEEYVCAENTHGFYVGKEAAAPIAAKPDF